MKYLKRKRKCLFLIIILIYFYYQIINITEEEEDIENNKSQINVIFNLEEWRQFFSNNQNLKDEEWCDIPIELESLSNSLCKVYMGKNCKRLPCQMVSSSSKTLKNIQCSNNGQINLKENNSIECQIGYSLDLFLNKLKPSIIVDSLTKFNEELYLNELNSKYRSFDSIWGIRFNFESISNYPWNKDENYLKLFDIKYGYDRSIYDFIPKPWLFNYIEQIHKLTIEQIIQMKKPISSSNIYWINQENIYSFLNKSSYVRSPILWLNSNCKTLSKRTEYVNELMKYIDVDNYGNCGKNILTLPEHIVQIQDSENKILKDRANYDWEKGKLALANDYLFTIAFENTFDYDYITEKIWHAFITGSVPIYYGAPNIYDWVPCEDDCFIDLTKFKTPKQAALFIRNIAQNKTLYLNYHLWRNKTINQKFKNIIQYFQKMDNYNLECLLCYSSHQVKLGFNKQSVINKLKQTISTF